MARPWFRMYREILGSPKIQRLKPEVFRAWVNILCCADDQGNIPPTDDLAFMLRVTDTKAAEYLVTLTKAGLIDKAAGGFAVHDWNDHQYSSDTDPTARDRKRRQRDKSRNVTRDMSVTERDSHAQGHEEVTRTDTDTDTEKKEDTPLPPRDSFRDIGDDAAGLTPSDPDDPGWPKAVDLRIAACAWNSVAGAVGLAKITALSGERPTHLRTRLKELGSLGEWLAAVNAIRDQPFLFGQNDRKWRANFDWFVKPGNFSKVVENTYERSAAHGRA